MDQRANAGDDQHHRHAQGIDAHLPGDFDPAGRRIQPSSSGGLTTAASIIAAAQVGEEQHGDQERQRRSGRRR